MEAAAVVAEEPGRVEFRAVSVPEPTVEDVVVRVRHSWISPGTERSMILGERIDGETSRGETDPLPFPQVPGYQKVGTIEWVGDAVPGFVAGDSVFATVSKLDDLYYPTGGHVSPAVTHWSQLWKIPHGVAPIALSGLVLTQVGFNCATRPAVGPDDAVVIVGDGLIGHWAAQTLVGRGARVMLVGKHADRLQFFASSAPHRTVDRTQEHPVDTARDWAPEGVQAVIDTVGSVADLEAFFPVMRRDGHLVSAGFHGTQGMIDIQRLRYRELTLHAPSGWTRPRMDATRDLIAQRVIQTERLITHRFPIAQASAAYDVVLARREPFLGVILDWD